MHHDFDIDYRHSAGNLHIQLFIIKPKKEKKMGKALIAFGTTTGNTEDMAGVVQKAMEDAGLQTELKSVMETTVNDLAADHDLVVLGCPAYGDDSIELQEDFEEFYEQMDSVQLNGKLFAVFAPGQKLRFLQDIPHALPGQCRASPGGHTDPRPVAAQRRRPDRAASLHRRPTLSTPKTPHPQTNSRFI